MKSIVTIVGARPQFIKAAVLSRLIRNEFGDAFSEYLVHTGQHYDRNMSEVFFDQLEIPKPDVNLEIGSGSHASMTAAMLVGIEKILLEKKPDLVLVYGDTNSTLAGALAAAKIHVPVAHVEAGLRSFNMRMPEEQNRVLTDHLSQHLFCPTETARIHLASAGITTGVSVVGDVMLDASLHFRNIASLRGVTPPGTNHLDEDYVLLTLHRAENTDDPERLSEIVAGINECQEYRFIFPVHPRTRKKLNEIGAKLGAHVRMIDPVGYLEMIKLEEHSWVIMTDSGGVQKEAYFFRKPCLTLRNETEWTETVDVGWNTLVPARAHSLSDSLQGVVEPAEHPPLYGEGDAGRIILRTLLSS